jgi:hypothetical protein
LHYDITPLTDEQDSGGNVVMQDLTPAYLTVACAVDDLTRRGFTEDFRVIDGKLRAVGTGETVSAQDLVIREYHRFEGVSDPDDMAIVYGVEAKNGLRGTVVDAFGVYSDPVLSALLEHVPLRQTV